MRRQIEARLVSLRREYEMGVVQVQELESRLVSLRQTVIRISGAIAVLEELLSSQECDTEDLVGKPETGSESGNSAGRPLR